MQNWMLNYGYIFVGSGMLVLFFSFLIHNIASPERCMKFEKLGAGLFAIGVLFALIGHLIA